MVCILSAVVISLLPAVLQCTSGYSEGLPKQNLKKVWKLWIFLSWIFVIFDSQKTTSPNTELFISIHYLLMQSLWACYMLRLNSLSHHDLYKGTVYVRLTIRGQERSNDGYEKRRIIEYVIKNYTLRNANKVLYYFTYHSTCIYIWILENGSRFEHSTPHAIRDACAFPPTPPTDSG
jgi:hypothetical protein